MEDQERTAELAPGEQERIDAALDLLAQDNHAPREISVRYVLHVHHEYPKVVAGKTVNSAEEEHQVLGPAEEADAGEPTATELGAAVRRLGLTGDTPADKPDTDPASE